MKNIFTITLFSLICAFANSAKGNITGPTTVCVGSTITLTDSVPGGVWTCSSPTIATIDSFTGVVTGISAGAVYIDYTLPTYAEGYLVNVNSVTSAGSISGPSSVYIGSTITLHDGVAGGIWSSSNASIASINASDGIVTGISNGTVTITYSVTGCTGPAATSYAVSSGAFTGISGHVYFTSGAYAEGAEVWLIHFNPLTSDLEAIDSTWIYSPDSVAFYEFAIASTDSFRIKAAPICSLCAPTGYLPTYHTSSFYWHDANVLYHTTGIADTNQDINMGYGTTTTGPGFIAGNVTTGANKGTSPGIPVSGLRIVLMNTTTGSIMQSTKTDASGDYTFNTLPYGTYTVFPDSINYMTTPYTNILSASTPNISNAAFIQHTISKTITPVSTGVNILQTSESSVGAFPNPTNGKLNIQWYETASEEATITFSDITGREVYEAAIRMNVGNGIGSVDITGLKSGLYLLCIKSANINYNAKIVLR